MAKYLEVNFSIVDRGVEQPTGFTAGALRFPVDDPTAEPEVLNPVDLQSVAVCKRYLDRLWKRQKELLKLVDEEE